MLTPQKALRHQSTIVAMQEWQAKRPTLFTIWVADHTEPDTQVSMVTRGNLIISSLVTLAEIRSRQAWQIAASSVCAAALMAAWDMSKKRSFFASGIFQMGTKRSRYMAGQGSPRIRVKLDP